MVAHLLHLLQRLELPLFLVVHYHLYSVPSGQSIDPLELEIKQRVGTDEERSQAKRVMPLIVKHHRLLVTLLLYNAAANETLPIFLDKVTTILSLVPHDPLLHVWWSLTWCHACAPISLFPGLSIDLKACAKVRSVV